MYISNNDINTPYLQNPGDVLIGTGTIPIAGPLIGGGGVTVTPLGTAIGLFSSSSYINFIQTFTWGTSNSDTISCEASTYASSFISSFTGTVSRVVSYWLSQSFPVSGTQSFSISVWDPTGGTRLATTPQFTPGTTGILMQTFTPPYPAFTSNMRYWVELQPETALGSYTIYGLSGGATNRLDFDRFQGGAPGVGGKPPNQLNTPSAVRIWFYLF